MEPPSPNSRNQPIWFQSLKFQHGNFVFVFSFPFLLKIVKSSKIELLFHGNKSKMANKWH